MKQAQPILTTADILLPRDRTPDSMRKWSTLACDQYTSDRSYWESTDALVGDAPSTLRMILPEVYLQDSGKEARIAAIGDAMKAYQNTVLTAIPNAMIYIERTVKSGKKRRGVIGAVDLEAYDYRKGSESPIRATEGTVLSRIPPRVQIRKDAPLEAPHVMLLIDDPADGFISAAANAKADGELLYDFELMQNGGRLSGWRMTDAEAAAVLRETERLGDPAAFCEKYGTEQAPLVFAVGDGNHSLATAKACYEAIKEQLGETAAKLHPARYALVEIVNLHDEALVFEPIYRVLFGATADALYDAMQAYYPQMTGSAASGDAHGFTMVSRGGERTFSVPNPPAQLPVGTLQVFLDAYLADHPAVTCDYIHGEDAVRSLAAKENTVGFLFSGMKKDELFRTVIFDGALPRKTFSMGEADEKRFYLECRSIR